MLYIDAFNHILPKKYQAVLEQKVPNRDMSSNLSRYAETVPTLLDLDARFRLMDSVEGYMQVLTLAAPTVESVASPEVAVDLCRFANDEMAELVEKYPDRFAAAIAALPRHLIADEVTSALDVLVQAAIVELLVELVRADGMTLVFVTHDLALAAGIADRVAVMAGGRLVEVGLAADAIAAPRATETAALIAAHIDLATPPLVGGAP